MLGYRDTGGIISMYTKPLQEYILCITKIKGDLIGTTNCLTNEGNVNKLLENRIYSIWKSNTKLSKQ